MSFPVELRTWSEDVVWLLVLLKLAVFNIEFQTKKYLNGNDISNHLSYAYQSQDVKVFPEFRRHIIDNMVLGFFPDPFWWVGQNKNKYK